MQLIRDLVDWIKEWYEWKMKDWLKAGIIALVVLIIIVGL